MAMTEKYLRTMDKKAMVFAAGLGTRLAPLTDNTPKALVSLNGKPLLWHVAKRLVDEGFNHITINVHHFAQQIIDYVKTPEYSAITFNGVETLISDESSELLDTGGGLRKAAPLLFAKDDAPVLIHNVDIMSNADLGRLYDSAGDCDALLLVSKRSTARYLLFDDRMRMVGWINKQTGQVRTPYDNLDLTGCRELAFSGIHVVSKRLVDTMQSWPEKFGIMDFYINSCKNLCIQGFEQPGLALTDIGKIEVLRKLQG